MPIQFEHRLNNTNAEKFNFDKQVLKKFIEIQSSSLKKKYQLLTKPFNNENEKSLIQLVFDIYKKFIVEVKNEECEYNKNLKIKHFMEFTIYIKDTYGEYYIGNIESFRTDYKKRGIKF